MCENLVYDRSFQFSHSVMSNSSATPWTAARQASLSNTNSWSLLKLMSIKSVMPSNHLILCCPLLFPAFNLSQQQGLFKWVSSSHQVAKVFEFQLQHQSSNEYSGWFPLGFTDLILHSKGLSRVFNTTVQKHHLVQHFTWCTLHIR